jgi:hypothetical protein
MLAGIGVIFFVNTSSGSASASNTIARNIYRGAN